MLLTRRLKYDNDLRSYVKVRRICAEPLRFPEDYRTNVVRRRRSDEKDSLALSREIFKNITKQLRENIKREGATDRNDHLLQSEYRF